GSGELAGSLIRSALHNILVLAVGFGWAYLGTLIESALGGSALHASWGGVAGAAPGALVSDPLLEPPPPWGPPLTPPLATPPPRSTTRRLVPSPEAWRPSARLAARPWRRRALGRRRSPRSLGRGGRASQRTWASPARRGR